MQGEMAYPLIILGAGASYDYSEFGRTAPLTQNLVDEAFMPEDLLAKYPGSGDLLSDIVRQVKVHKRGFEEVLTEIRNRSGDTPYIASQFAALEFYLQALFKRLSSPNGATRMHEVNNYRALLNRIQTHADGKACVVTFNYDSLFELNLRGQAPRNMEAYILGDIKIIKLHGSHNWHYIQNKELIDYTRLGINKDDDFALYFRNPDFIERMYENDKTLSPYHELELQELPNADIYARFPAIAVPLVGKERYVCPVAHIAAFEKILPEVDRILVIGWKAGDPLLFETLRKHLQKNKYRILVVSNTLPGAEEIKAKFEDELDCKYVAARGAGFSAFLDNETSHSFFTERITYG